MQLPGSFPCLQLPPWTLPHPWGVCHGVVAKTSTQKDPQTGPQHQLLSQLLHIFRPTLTQAGLTSIRVGHHFFSLHCLSHLTPHPCPPHTPTHSPHTPSLPFPTHRMRPLRLKSQDSYHAMDIGPFIPILTRMGNAGKWLPLVLVEEGDPGPVRDAMGSKSCRMACQPTLACRQGTCVGVPIASPPPTLLGWTARPNTCASSTIGSMGGGGSKCLQ